MCLKLLLLLSFCLSAVNTEPDHVVPTKCPGLYCGRIDSSSSCGACPRGFRPNESSICEKCENTPTFYDWLYLGFMAVLAPALNCFFIDFTNKRKLGALLSLHASAIVESIGAAIATLLVMEPIGSLSITSCPVHQLADFYTMFFNPNPDYTSTLHCTQEVVYPLYSMVMVYYAFCLLAMLLLRPLLSSRCVHHRGSKSIYAALYFYPILVAVQAVFAGLIYYAYPYITIVVSIVTSAAHFAHFEEQSMSRLLRQNFTDPRNIMILIAHWLLHAYGIIAVTELRDPPFHAALLCLVPFPAFFYILTVKFTSPDKLESV